MLPPKISTKRDHEEIQIDSVEAPPGDRHVDDKSPDVTPGSPDVRDGSPDVRDGSPDVRDRSPDEGSAPDDKLVFETDRMRILTNSKEDVTDKDEITRDRYGRVVKIERNADSKPKCISVYVHQIE